MKWALFAIWLIFAGIFGVLAWQNWKMKNKKVPHITIQERPMRTNSNWTILQAEVGGEDIDAPQRRFVDEFNKYIDDYNQSQYKSNKLQATGYWIACGTAVFSAVIALII